MAKGFGNIMKQAQKLQAQMAKVQEEMANKTVETSVGGGMVKVVANGKQEVVSIKIEPEVIDPRRCGDAGRHGALRSQRSLEKISGNALGRDGQVDRRDEYSGFDVTKMAGYPKPITDLVRNLCKLPGVGAKSAMRMALFLLDSPDEEVKALGLSIAHLKERITFCRMCHNFTDEEICSICRDQRRDTHVLCVVEEPGDLMAIEDTGSYKGLVPRAAWGYRASGWRRAGSAENRVAGSPGPIGRDQGNHHRDKSDC